jgi:hypothetical protein
MAEREPMPPVCDIGVDLLRTIERRRQQRLDR